MMNSSFVWFGFDVFKNSSQLNICTHEMKRKKKYKNVENFVAPSSLVLFSPTTTTNF